MNASQRARRIYEHEQELIRQLREVNAPTDPAPPPSSPRTYHGVTCSLVELDDTDDDYRVWYVRCRDEQADEEIMVAQHRGTLKLRPYYPPERFHRAATAYVRAEPEWEDGEY
jgi:hypothetical protein